jgi:hypothetical protein
MGWLQCCPVLFYPGGGVDNATMVSMVFSSPRGAGGGTSMARLNCGQIMREKRKISLKVWALKKIVITLLIDSKR